MLTEIVGREPELAEVRRFLDAVEETPQVVVLEGDPGIGKTTVWRAGVALAAEAGYRVLRCSPSEAEAGLAHVALADLVGDVPAAVREALPAPQRQALDQVLMRAEIPSSGIDARALGAAMLSMLDELGAVSPVLLAIDDWQWMDSSSLDVVAFALRRIEAPVGVLAAVRPEHPELRSRMGRDSVTRVPVGPLGTADLHRVLETHLARTFPRPSLERIAAFAGGNPWFALELARSFGPQDHEDPAPPLPDTLGHLVHARLADIGDEGGEIMLAAAAMAEPSVEQIQAVVGQQEADVRRRLGEAEDAGLVELRGNRVGFVHPLLAAGVLDAAPKRDIRAMHRRLAAVVTDVEERARHCALGAISSEPETIRALDRAAEHARARGAPAVAAEFLELALRLGAESDERVLTLAGHWLDAGDVARARALAEKAVATCPTGPVRASALRVLATIRLHDDSYAEAADHLETALAEPGVDGGQRGRLLVEYVYVLANLGRILEARERATEAVSTLEELDEPGQLAQALAAQVMTRFLSGDGLDEATRLRALDLEQSEEPVPVMLRPSLISALVLAWSGRLDEGREILHAVRRGCLERGEESDVVYTAFHLAILDCWAGDLSSARLVADDSLERARQLGSEIAVATARATQAVVAAHTGDVDEGRSGAREALEVFQRGSCLAAMVWPTVTLGLVELSLGNHAEAADILAPMVAGARAMGYGEPTAAPYAADAAEAMIGAGRPEEARELVEHLEAEGRRLDRAWALALGARCRALQLVVDGEPDAALSAVETALEEHRRLPMPFELARTQLVLGQIQRRRRQKRASAAAFEQALATFEEMGARRWADRARGELERVKPGRGAGDELSPSEERVAELAATGLTNREVAQALFVHPKTVEAHLSRVYRKLGIGSRAELGRYMAESDAQSEARSKNSVTRRPSR